MKTESSPLRSQTELQAARYEFVSRLADDLAHEVKNPLHSMVINLEVLRRRVASGATAEALQRADVIGVELARVHQLVEQILLLLLPDREGVRVLDLDDALAEIVPLLDIRARAEHKTLRFVATGDAALVRASADAVKFAVLVSADWATAATPERAGAIVIHRTVEAASVSVAIEAHHIAAPQDPADEERALDDALALVRAVLAAHGDAFASNRTDRGYRGITLALPRAAGA